MDETEIDSSCGYNSSIIFLGFDTNSYGLNILMKLSHEHGFQTQDVFRYQPVILLISTLCCIEYVTIDEVNILKPFKYN